MIILVRNRKSEHDHWIVHIQISIGSKLQLKLTKIFFWTRFTQKRYFWSKTEKVNIIIEFCIFEFFWLSNFRHPSHAIQETLLRSVKVSTSSVLYPDFFRLPTFLDWSDIQFFYSPLSNHSQLGYVWLPTPHCPALVWLTGHHALPAVTRSFLPNPHLRK